MQEIDEFQEKMMKETALKMLKKNIDIETISAITGLSIKQIEELNNQKSQENLAEEQKNVTSSWSDKPFIAFKLKPIYNLDQYKFFLYDELSKKYPYIVELLEPYYEVPTNSLDLNTTYGWKFQGKNDASSTWEKITPLIKLDKLRSSESKYHKLEWIEPDDMVDDGATKIYRVFIRDRLQEKILDKHIVLDNQYMLDISKINPEVIIYRIQIWAWKSGSWIDFQDYCPVRIIKDHSLFKRISENKGIPMDLELFSALNVEYENKRYIFNKSRFKNKKSTENNTKVSKTKEENKQPSTRTDKISAAEKRAITQAEKIHNALNMKGKRILEVGCKTGECAYIISKNYDCQVTAVDISSYPIWEEMRNSNLEYYKIDLGKDSIDHLGQFDIIYSMVVWEHVVHPYAMLAATRKLLKDTGKFYFRTTLHRGVAGSHLYNDIYFPWPHLLFSDEVFKEYYISKGLPPRVPSWLNTLTVSHYLYYFNKIGFKIDNIKYTKLPMDEVFYQSFKDKLSRYPRFDLETNFVDAILSV